MEPTNYLRQAWPVLDRQQRNPNNATKLQRERLAQFLKGAPLAQKFCIANASEFLPGQTEGVDERVEAIEWRLPYDSVLIEYLWRDGEGQGFPCMALAIDIGDSIAVLVAGYFGGDQIKNWMVIPGVLVLTKSPLMGLTTRFRVGSDPELEDRRQRVLSAALQSQGRIVLQLIDALSCRNVVAVPLPVRPLNKSAARRGALPFDAYHVVMVEPRQAKGEDTFSESIGAEHRSPREHLRRGTIVTNRRGTRFWRQGTVVNAGHGGKITKDYVVKP